jgi:hypothetical protein
MPSSLRFDWQRDACRTSNLNGMGGGMKKGTVVQNGDRFANLIGGQQWADEVLRQRCQVGQIGWNYLEFRGRVQRSEKDL